MPSRFSARRSLRHGSTPLKNSLTHANSEQPISPYLPPRRAPFYKVFWRSRIFPRRLLSSSENISVPIKHSSSTSAFAGIPHLQLSLGFVPALHSQSSLTPSSHRSPSKFLSRARCHALLALTQISRTNRESWSCLLPRHPFTSPYRRDAPLSPFT
jgi:hypothetical protein